MKLIMVRKEYAEMSSIEKVIHENLPLISHWHLDC